MSVPAAPLRRLCLSAGLAAGLGLPAWRATAAETGAGAGSLVLGQTLGLHDGPQGHGAGVLAGVQAALMEIEARGGVHGRRLVLRTLDDQGRAETAAANARQLVDDGAFVLFGCIEGGPSTAVMRVAHETGVPLIAPMAGSPALRRPLQPLVFPVRAEHRDEFRALLTYARGVGLQRVALFHSATDVGRQHLENLRLLCAELGLGYGGGIPFKPDISDAQLAAAAGGLAQQRVDLVLNHGSPATYGRLLRQARAVGSRTAFWGVNSGSSRLAESLGPLARGMVFAQVVPHPWSRKTALVRDYQPALQATHPGRPFGYSSLEGYASTRALALMLERAGPAPTRPALLQALSSFQADLGGMRVAYSPGAHDGSGFVDLALVGRDGRFIQ